MDMQQVQVLFTDRQGRPHRASPAYCRYVQVHLRHEHAARTASGRRL